MPQRSLLLVLFGLVLGVLTILWVALEPVVRTTEPRFREALCDATPAPDPVPLSAREPDVRHSAVAPDAEDSGSEEASPALTDEQLAEAAELLVTLTDGSRPVGPATLTVHGTLDGNPETEETDAVTGQALFTGLEKGHQHVYLSGLPPGWILASTGPRVPASGHDAVEVDLLPGANACEIRLERAARVFGLVLGPEGEPLDTACVQMTRFDAEDKFGRRPTVWLSVEGGSFHGDLQEGIWSGQVIGLGPGESGTIRDTRLRDFLAPTPQVQKLHAGSTAQMDFVCDRFSGVIEGRILDESNRPFGGLQMKASRITTMTEPETGRVVTVAEDAGRDLSTTDGRFAFANLGRGSYRIQVDRQLFFAVGPPGINGIGAPIEPVDVTFGAEPKLRVQIAARRSHQVRVRGSIVLSRSALAAEESTPSIFLSARAGGFRRETVRSWIEGSDRQFDFYVESAVQDPCLEVTIGGERAVYPLTLRPEIESTQLVLRFPN